MDITFLESFRGYPKGWCGDVPAQIAQQALSDDLAEHTSVVKRRIGRHPSEVDRPVAAYKEGSVETATSRNSRETAATRTGTPSDDKVEYSGGGWWSTPYGSVRAGEDADPEEVLRKARED